MGTSKNAEAALDRERQLRARAETQLSSCEASAKAAIAKLEAQLAEASAAQSRLHKAVEESNVSHLSQVEELRFKSLQMAKEQAESLGLEVQQRVAQCVQLNEKLDWASKQLEKESEEKRLLKTKLENAMQQSSANKLQLDGAITLLRVQLQEAQSGHQRLEEELRRARTFEDEQATEVSLMRSEKVQLTQELASLQVPPSPGHERSIVRRDSFS